MQLSVQRTKFLLALEKMLLSRDCFIGAQIKVKKTDVPEKKVFF